MRDYGGLLGRSQSRNREAQQVIHQSIAFGRHGRADRGADRLSPFIDGKALIALDRAKVFKIKIRKRIGKRRLDALESAPPPRSSKESQPDVRKIRWNTVGVGFSQGLILDPARLPMHSSIVELSAYA